MLLHNLWLLTSLGSPDGAPWGDSGAAEPLGGIWSNTDPQWQHRLMTFRVYSCHKQLRGDNLTGTGGGCSPDFCFMV